VTEETQPSLPFLIQLFHEEGMVDEFISLSSSLDPDIAAHSIILLIVLHYEREWVEREIYINKLIQLSSSVDSVTQRDISHILDFFM
jgi:hypothetical protein